MKRNHVLFYRNNATQSSNGIETIQRREQRSEKKNIKRNRKERTEQNSESRLSLQVRFEDKHKIYFTIKYKHVDKKQL